MSEIAAESETKPPIRSALIEPLRGNDKDIWAKTEHMSLNAAFDFCDTKCAKKPSSDYWKLKVEQIYGNVAVLQRSDFIDTDQWETYARLSYTTYEYMHSSKDNTAILRVAAKPNELGSIVNGKIVLYDNTDGISYFNVRALPLHNGQKFYHINYTDNLDTFVYESIFFIDVGITSLWIQERISGTGMIFSKLHYTIYNSPKKFSKGLVEDENNIDQFLSDLFEKFEENKIFTVIFDVRYQFQLDPEDNLTETNVITRNTERQIVIELNYSTVKLHSREFL